MSTVALGEMVGTDALLSSFDVDDIATEALLFQTGYLTILEERSLGGRALYRLGYPNREVAGEGAAMAQLKERRYADKYRGAGEPIHLVAVEFSRDARNVTAFEVEAG